MKSTTLDNWNSKYYRQFVSKGGNIKVNAIYEAKLSPDDKVTPSSQTHELKKFVSDKYEKKLWYSKQDVKDDVTGDDEFDDDSTDSSSDW